MGHIRWRALYQNPDWRRDKKGIEQGLQQGIEKGIQQGIEKGIEQGIEQGALQKAREMAKGLRDAGVAISIISQQSGLSEDEIKSL